MSHFLSSLRSQDEMYMPHWWSSIYQDHEVFSYLAVVITSLLFSLMLKQPKSNYKNNKITCQTNWWIGASNFFSESGSVQLIEFLPAVEFKHSFLYIINGLFNF